MYPTSADDVCKLTHARNPPLTGLRFITNLQPRVTGLQSRFEPGDGKGSEEVADGVHCLSEKSGRDSTLQLSC